MFSLESAIELVEKLTNLKMVDKVYITESDLIKEETLSRFDLYPAPSRKRNKILSDEERIDTSVFDILGEYDPDKTQITIYKKMIELAVEAIGDNDIDIDSLRDVVLFHEVAHAVTHIAKDGEGRIWDKFKDASNFDKELFAQLYPYLLFNNFGVFSKHLYVFSALCKYQSIKYNLWIMLRDLTLNEINQALSNARQNNIPFPDFFIEIDHSGGIPLVAEVRSWYQVHADGSCYRLKLNLNKMPIKKPDEPEYIRILRLLTESSSKIPHEKLVKARRLLPELAKQLENNIDIERIYKESALFRIIETLIDFEDEIIEKVAFPQKACVENIRTLYNSTLPLLYIPVPQKIFGPIGAIDSVATTITIFWGGKLWGTWTAINNDWSDYSEVFGPLIEAINVCLRDFYLQNVIDELSKGRGKQ
jgi:hypothetical protein